HHTLCLHTPPTTYTYTLSLHDALPISTAIDVSRDDARTEHRLQRPSDRLQRHTQLGRTAAIHRHAQLRLALLVAVVEIAQARILTRQVQHLVGPLRQRFIVGTAEHGFEHSSRAAPAETAERVGHGTPAGHGLLRPGDDRIGDLLRGPFPIVPIGEHQEDARRIHIAGARLAATAATRYAQHDVLDIAMQPLLLERDGFEPQG